MGPHIKRNEKGFTLIELLIVVGIIALLASVAIVNLIPAQQRSRYARAAADTKEIVTQAMVVVSDNNQPITLIAGMTAPPVGLWDTTAPNNLTYMAAVSDPWAAGTACIGGGLGQACYQFLESVAVGCAAVGPGCVVYSAWTVGADGANDGPWTGLIAAGVPVNDDLGNSSVMGCAFGPNINIANPC